MEIRQKYFKKKRKILATNTSNFFTNHLSRRGYSGYISFDHSRETLNLIVSTVVVLLSLLMVIGEIFRIVINTKGGAQRAKAPFLPQNVSPLPPAYCNKKRLTFIAGTRLPLLHSFSRKREGPSVAKSRWSPASKTATSTNVHGGGLVIKILPE